MNLFSHWPRGLFLVLVVTRVLLLSAAGSELVADRSGTLLFPTEESAPSSAPLTLASAITVPEAISTAPIATESFSTIQYAPAEPALILPVSAVFGPGPMGFVAMVEDDTDPAALVGEIQPVPEPATWWAGVIVAPVLLWSLGRHRRRQAATKT